MESLRKPFFFLALVAILAAVLIEFAALRPTDVARLLPRFLTGSPSPALDQALDVLTPEQKAKVLELQRQKSGELAGLTPDLNGFGARSLLFVDSFLLFTLALMTTGLFVPEPVQARLQGCVTLIFAIVVILAALVFLFVVVAKLLFMVALLLAIPFGTLIYFIIFGSFPRQPASAVVALLFVLRLAFGGLLVLAQQRFLQNLGLVIYTLAAFVAGLIVAFLYGLVPGFLASITDAIAAIVVAIIGIILGIVMAVGAIVSIVAALQP